MKTKLLLLLTLILSAIGFTQDYKTDFYNFLNKEDTLGQINTLTKWEKENPSDAELYTAYFNYYFVKAKIDFFLISEVDENGSVSLEDSTGNVVAYLSDKIIYNVITIYQGIDKIEQGIALYPNRLDMWFGKIYALGQIESWTLFTKEIIEVIHLSANNNNEWLWTDNEKETGGESFFLTSIQDYQVLLYETGADSLLENMRQIAYAILEHYPNDVDSHTNIGISYMAVNEFEKGLPHFLKAEKLVPTDGIVLSNIAQLYYLSNQKEKAILYYQKIIDISDDYLKDFAKKQIETIQAEE